MKKNYWKIWLLLIILLPLSLIPASQAASGSQDYTATLTNIQSAMNALLVGSSGADLRCGHDGGFFIQNDQGCNTNADLTDKIWQVYGYSSLYVFGTNSGEKQNEYAFLSSMYTPQTILSSAPVKVGTHSGLVTIEVYGGQLLTFLYWGDLNVFSVFHGATDLGDFDTLNADQKNQKIKALFDQSVAYAQKLEDKLVQFHAYDATSSPPQEPTKHLPIIFIPGVAGSYLYNGGTQTWPRAGTDAKYMFLQKDGINPVDTTAQISATQMLSSKGPFNVYGGMENYLQTKNYTLNTDLFEFAYDWRLDNTKHLQELDQLVNSVLDKTHASKVILIAHSMGGLIARAYVNDMGASKVDTLISVGTPFYGAVKPYYALVNGYDFGNPFATQLSMKIMAQNAPAVYQLLPRVPFLQDLESSHDLTLDESNQIHYKGVQSGTIRYYETPENSWSFNPSLIQSANAFHSKLGAKDNPVALPTGVKHYVIIGTGVSTLNGYDVINAPQDKQFVELLNRHVWLVPQFEDGDGTVPLWSSQISGVTQTYYIPYKSGASSEHGSLTDNPDVQKIVGTILKGSPSDPLLYSYENHEVTKTDYTSFSLHSDAHLTILDKQSGKSLGFNNQGEVDEGIDTGTFLAMDGGEYASISDISKTYKVLVNGTGDGKFTLITNVTKSGQSTVFSYKDVPVQKGTIAQVEITPSQMSLSNMPTLQVISGGHITSLSPTPETNHTTVPEFPISLFVFAIALISTVFFSRKVLR